MDRTCRECERPETEIEFKPKANICVDCHREYMKEYRRRNREKLRGQIQDWKDKNREKHRESNRKNYATPEGKAGHVRRTEKTYRSWLGHIISALKGHSINPGKHDPKSGPKRDYDIDLDYVMEILESQEYKCAITGVELTHQYNDMRAASIDRIDSEKGHVKGNIQLLCQAVNHAKRHHTQSDIVSFFRSVVQSRVIGSGGIIEELDVNGF